MLPAPDKRIEHADQPEDAFKRASNLEKLNQNNHTCDPGNNTTNRSWHNLSPFIE
jgi:hypothetical protein